MDIPSQVCQPNHLYSLGNPAPTFIGTDTTFQAERRVAGNSSPGQERVPVILKDHGHTRRRSVNHFAVESHNAASRFQQAAEDAQKGGLSDAGSSDDRDDLAFVDFKRDVL